MTEENKEIEYQLALTALDRIKAVLDIAMNRSKTQKIQIKETLLRIEKLARLEDIL